MSVFRPQRLPSLNRLPEELGRGERPCEHCERETPHILYKVPKKMVLFYVKEHPSNLHATCRECARSTILTGEDREKTLNSLKTMEG